MPVLCLKTGQCLKNVRQQCMSSLTATSLLPTYLVGEGGEVGVETERKFDHGKNAAVYLPIVGLIDI
jgi:hypothetical protein